MSEETEPRAEDSWQSRRGHSFYAPQNDCRGITGLNPVEDIPADEESVCPHYFTAGVDWFVSESNLINGDAYGLINPRGQGGKRATGAHLRSNSWTLADLGRGTRLLLRPDTFGNVVFEYRW